MTPRGNGDEGQAEHARSLSDVRVLLEFLGRQADNRLQAQFDDTRKELAAPTRRLAAPPCHTYRHFLERLSAIGIWGDAKEQAQPAKPGAPEGDERLGNEAFLSYSRDFLAAVAAPATVDTIRLTRAYVRARRYPLWERLWHQRLCRCGQRSQPATPPRDQHRGDEERLSGARRLARRVVLCEYFAIIALLATIATSIYAISGHPILESHDQIAAKYQAISQEREKLAEKLRSRGIRVSESQFLPNLSCDPAASPDQIIPARKDSTETLVASNASIGGGAADSPEYQPQVCALYWQLKLATQDVTAVTLHLISWTRVVFRLRYLGDAFGVDRPFILDAARQHDEYCKYLHLTGTRAQCTVQLEDLVYQAREVAESLLKSIALYVLPTLYGCLGAAMATIRNLRQKVDLSLVAMTDRGRVQQDIILGALCGAVMSLFAGYFGNATATGGLGLSALALLAGYNVPALLSLLDSLSSRLFHPKPQPGAG